MALVKYTGDECVHCKHMEPLIQRLEQELKLTVIRKEIWHNAQNQAEFKQRAAGKCRGIPFFFNEETGSWICGATNYDKLKEWATGKSV
ncbi:hypothetical protein HYW21_02045 [Candidatus Woesearchaeota archaeon]|nr:hypothetical protein [Candidatus Woesearchaeota archaeon]